MARTEPPKGRKRAAPVETPFGRLCLVAPDFADPDAFEPLLDSALSGGDVASLILPLEALDPGARLAAARRLVPIAQGRGVAAILVGDAGLVAASGADGLHVEIDAEAVRQAVSALHPDRIVGAGGVRTRHEAMVIGETGCDYLFFGRLDGDSEPGIHDKALDLAAWWSVVFEVPAIVMGGSSIDSVDEAVDARIEFVALRSAVWEHADGPAAAVAAANRRILARQAEAAT